MLKKDFMLDLDVDKEERIDRWISLNSDFSRSDVKKLIEGDAILVDGITVRKSSFTVRPGQKIRITAVVQKEILAKPENIDLDIIYEDEYLVVINKPSGMVVHPAPGHHSGTLVNALLHHFKDLSTISGDVRPGIVHRIDKDTTGLLIVAKDNETHRLLSEELKQHKIKRTYLAWVKGRIENDTTHIDLPIGRDPQNRQRMAVTKENSKHAITHVYVEKLLSDKTLVRCELETGRTHQIRVHLAYIKHPILNDPFYGNGKNSFGQYLHAYKLEFIHPITGKEMKFEVKPPKEFMDIENE